MDYPVFIKYAVQTAMVALPRHELHSKICTGSEILEVLHDDPATKQYLFSFYNSQFDRVSLRKFKMKKRVLTFFQFFRALAFVEQDMKNDRFTHEHYKYYTREMRILAYNQQLKVTWFR